LLLRITNNISSASHATSRPDSGPPIPRSWSYFIWRVNLSCLRKGHALYLRRGALYRVTCINYDLRPLMPCILRFQQGYKNRQLPISSRYILHLFSFVPERRKGFCRGYLSPSIPLIGLNDHCSLVTAEISGSYNGVILLSYDVSSVRLLRSDSTRPLSPWRRTIPNSI
jgi:hypothetical protein